MAKKYIKPEYTKSGKRKQPKSKPRPLKDKFLKIFGIEIY